MWFYNILSVVIAIIVAIAALYLLFRLFVLKQGNEKVILLPKREQTSKYLTVILNLLPCSVIFHL